MTNYSACYIQTALVYRAAIARQTAQIDSLQKVLSANQKTMAPISENDLAIKKEQVTSDVTTAVDLLDKCVDVVPWDSRPRMLRQDFLLNSGRLAEAEKRVKEALSVDPGNQEYHRMAAQVYALEGKKEPNEKN
jgi:Flp pilus assembly protein TadD